MATISVIFDGKVFVPQSAASVPEGTRGEVNVLAPVPPASSDAELRVEIDGIKQAPRHPVRKRGMLRHERGGVWMAPDFDESHEDFAEYM